MRAAIIAFGVLLLAGAAVALRCGAAFPAAIPAAVFGTLILLGTLAERLRYKRLGGAPRGSGWHASRERFVDPSSGQLVAVWHNDATGERRYVRIGLKPE